MVKSQKIVCVVGLCGAGKSEVVETLKKHDFINVYFGEVTFDELKRQRLEINEANERKVREQLRATGDLAIYAKMSEQKIVKALSTGKNVCIESLYSWSEYKYIKEKFGDKVIILSVVTNFNKRVQRLKSRPIRPLTKEEVTSRDYAQIEKLEQGGPIARGDYFLLNNRCKRNLQSQIAAFLKDVDVLKK